MKLSSSLLQSIALGVSVTIVASACRRDEVKTGEVKPSKHEKKEQKQDPDYCPACGMG